MKESKILPRKSLPDKVLVAYATECNDLVIKAVRDSVNVVIWSFMEIQKDIEDNVIVTGNSLDFECIRKMIKSLDNEGYQEVVHLVSFGGWNGPHLEPKLSVVEWYETWKDSVGDIFHGIDWDLEGHDNLDSPTNVFSINCLEKMGCISEMAKKDGYIIGVAPPQSYLDVQSSQFSRYVNLTEPERPWHGDFNYFGCNVYAYLIAKYGSYIDFISIQFYESYSRAAMCLYHDRLPEDEYLKSYVEDLLKNDESFFVDFDSDPALHFSSRKVALPLSKLVFGFANGWASNMEEHKVAFFDPINIQHAYHNLQATGRDPRGFMFWVIGEGTSKQRKYRCIMRHYRVATNHCLMMRNSEGTNGINYARDLAKIIGKRSRTQDGDL